MCIYVEKVNKKKKKKKKMLRRCMSKACLLRGHVRWYVERLCVKVYEGVLIGYIKREGRGGRGGYLVSSCLICFSSSSSICTACRSAPTSIFNFATCTVNNRRSTLSSHHFSR